jgi:hypothetical protein
MRKVRRCCCLGGGHDLADNAERIGGDAEYVRVTSNRTGKRREMKPMTDESNPADDLKPSIVAAWVLCLVAAGVTVWVCLAIGGTYFAWVVECCKNLGIMDWIPFEILGAVAFGPLIAPGLVAFLLGTKMFAFFGLRPFDSTQDSHRADKRGPNQPEPLK